MRVTAITSRWLFASERYEEAVLELDALGNVSELKDSLALFLIARHSDMKDQERKRLLQKAIEVAACDEEKQLARLNLASSLLEGANTPEALSLIRLVIEETDGDQSSTERSAALILLWKITRAEEDFRVAFSEMEKDDRDEVRRRNAIYLIDGGKYHEAEDILAKLISAGDVEAKLLLTDARLRSGAGESAGELFSTIEAKSVPPHLQYPYAVAISLLVLVGGLISLRNRAISLLDDLLPTGGEQDKQVKLFLQSLKSMTPRESE
jgi:tetratricopeptide (TPR) repeat protein